MTRTKGARSSGYESRRAGLADKLRARLARTGGKRPSFAELAKAAGVSLATLRHYFTDREGVVAAVLEIHSRMGDEHLAVLGQPLDDFASSINAAALQIGAGLRETIVADLHVLGIAEGLDHSASGPSYLINILEPLTQALEQRIRAHVERGDMRECDLRSAALGLIAPLVIAHLHQDWLGGCVVRPLDQMAHLESQVQAFVLAYAA